MSFDQTALLRHPTVEKAYALVEKAIGITHADVKKSIAAAELYCAKVKEPNPDVAAALLFRNHAFPESKKMGPAVYALAELAIQMEGANSVLTAQSVDHADILLAQVTQEAKLLEKEIKKNQFYVFDTMQQKILSLHSLMHKGTIQHGKSAKKSFDLIDAVLESLISMENAQAQRIEKTRNDSVFAKSGLPAHPLVEKVYEAERYHDFKVNPHCPPLTFELAAVRILLAEVDMIEPDVIAAALLNQCFGPRAERIAHLYGPRVAELHAATAPRLGRVPELYLPVKGSDDIRAAFLMVFLQSRMDGLATQPKEYREETLFEIERAVKKARTMVADAPLSPRLLTRLNLLAYAGEAVVNAPENTAIRKPGAPRPVSGW